MTARRSRQSPALVATGAGALKANRRTVYIGGKIERTVYIGAGKEISMAKKAKKIESVKAWAVWHHAENRPYVREGGCWEMFASWASAKQCHWTRPAGKIIPVLIVPITPKRRKKK